MRAIAGAGLLATVVAGCATYRPGAAASPIGEWRVIAINGTPVSGAAFAASFTASEGTAQFGCNRGGGPVRASWGKVVPGDWVVTVAGCMPKERMRFERPGFDVLAQPMQVTRTVRGVRLTSSAGTVDLAP